MKSFILQCLVAISLGILPGVLFTIVYYVPKIAASMHRIADALENTESGLRDINHSIRYLEKSPDNISKSSDDDLDLL